MCVSIAHLLEKESGIRQIEKRRKSAGVVGLFAFLPHQPFGLTTVRPRRLVALRALLMLDLLLREGG
jgi:hypothetical protein